MFEKEAKNMQKPLKVKVLQKQVLLKVQSSAITRLTNGIL